MHRYTGYCHRILLVVSTLISHVSLYNDISSETTESILMKLGVYMQPKLVKIVLIRNIKMVENSPSKPLCQI